MTLVVKHATITGAAADSTALVDGPAWDAAHALSGTADASQLNPNVVQAVTNDTNVTGSIASQSLTLSWTGTLAPVRGGLGVDASASSGVPVWTTGVPTFTATTGSGNVVRATSPTLVTPALGTPASGILTNCTAFTLTTTGSSGAASYSGGILNIPQYSTSGALLAANNLSDVASAPTSMRNLGGLDLSTTVAITTTTTLTTSAFGKLHLISGTSSYTVTLPTPVGNTGAIIALSVDAYANATKLYTIASPSGNVGRATSLIMWASEQLILRSDGTNWVVISSRQIPFVGTLNRNTNLSLTGTYAEVPLNAAASNDPTGLNLAYDSVNFRFVAPRTASWILTPYSYQTQGGSPTTNHAAVGDSGNSPLVGTLMASSLTAGVISAPQTIRLTAGSQGRLIARADGTSAAVAGATLPARLDYQEIVPSW